MDDKVKGAIAGFNFGFGGYLVLRTVLSFWSKNPIDFGWIFWQAMIGLVIGVVLAAVVYVAMGQMQK